MDKIKQAKWFLNPEVSFLRLQKKVARSNIVIRTDEYLHSAYTTIEMRFDEEYDTAPEMINDYIKLEEYLDS